MGRTLFLLVAFVAALALEHERGGVEMRLLAVGLLLAGPGLGLVTGGRRLESVLALGSFTGLLAYPFGSPGVLLAVLAAGLASRPRGAAEEATLAAGGHPFPGAAADDADTEDADTHALGPGADGGGLAPPARTLAEQHVVAGLAVVVAGGALAAAPLLAAELPGLAAVVAVALALVARELVGARSARAHGAPRSSQGDRTRWVASLGLLAGISLLAIQGGSESLLAIAAAVVGVALALPPLALSAPRAKGRALVLPLAAGLLVAALTALVPERPATAPLLALGIALPALALEGAARKRERRLLARVLRVALGVTLAWAAVAWVRYALLVRPSLGETDFFFDLCWARDPGAGTIAVQHEHTPAVRLLLAAIGATDPAHLARAQWLSLGLLVADAALVAAVVWRHARSALASAFAGVWFLAMVSSLEGAEACSEPLAVLPLLLGLLAWEGVPLRGRGGFARAVALGSALGLAAFGKRQALFHWSAGAAILAGTSRARADRHSPAIVAVGLATTVASFGGAIVLSRGPAALAAVLETMTVYRTEGGFWSALASHLGKAPALALVFPLAGAAGAIAWRLGRGASVTRERSALAFSGIAALAGVLPWAKKPYAHVALLAVPFVATGATLGSLALARRLPARLRMRPGLLAIALAVVAVALVRRDRWAPTAYAWPLEPPPGKIARWRDEPGVARDLARLETLVAPGETLLLLPPLHDEVYYFLRANAGASPLAYAFVPDCGVGIEPVSWERLDAVLVARRREPAEELSWKAFGCEAIVGELPAHGFRPRASLEMLELWRREPSGRR